MPHTMLRFPTVKARTSLSRSTIYLRISRGTFPAPVSLGGRAVGWIEAEVNAWLTARIAQRRLIAAPGSGGSRQRLPASSKTRSSRAWRRGRSGGSPASAERVGESGGGGGSRTRVRNYLAKRIYVCIQFLVGFAARH